MLAVYLSMLKDRADRADFAALYERCKGRALYLAAQIVQNDAQAEEAVHEGFLYMAEHYQRLKRDCPQGLDGYFFQCVESRALNQLRAQAREWGDEESLQGLESPRAQVEQQVIAAEQLERAIAAINALDAIYRVTLTLHYQSGMSVQEIAEATGVSVKTAQKRLERARAKVLQEVEADDA